MNLGSSIRELRKQRKVTQAGLASLCNISQTYLSQIENNQKEPTLTVLKQIGLQLNFPLPFLFFISMTEDDIPMDKRKAYTMLGPPVKALINEFFKI
jgi:transcriptional regulator with XRE-family HTH domain